MGFSKMMNRIVREQQADAASRAASAERMAEIYRQIDEEDLEEARRQWDRQYWAYVERDEPVLIHDGIYLDQDIYNTRNQ